MPHTQLLRPTPQHGAQSLLAMRRVAASSAPRQGMAARATAAYTRGAAAGKPTAMRRYPAARRNRRGRRRTLIFAGAGGAAAWFLRAREVALERAWFTFARVRAAAAARPCRHCGSCRRCGWCMATRSRHRMRRRCRSQRSRAAVPACMRSRVCLMLCASPFAYAHMCSCARPMLCVSLLPHACTLIAASPMLCASAPAPCCALGFFRVVRVVEAGSLVRHSICHSMRSVEHHRAVVSSPSTSLFHVNHRAYR
mmetsp:Transcript_7841/g.23580  ORF Transcript_7841/g.23580 Transcript_7841/m.23580 type:complete len:253 (+) Transcript_7841:3896-4654(+)